MISRLGSAQATCGLAARVSLEANVRECVLCVTRWPARNQLTAHAGASLRPGSLTWLQRKGAHKEGVLRLELAGCKDLFCHVLSLYLSGRSAAPGHTQKPDECVAGLCRIGSPPEDAASLDDVATSSRLSSSPTITRPRGPTLSHTRICCSIYIFNRDNKRALALRPKVATLN